MSSETNSEITSRNLSRVSGFGYRENISTRSVRDSKADLPGLLRKLRTGIIGKRIIPARWVGAASDHIDDNRGVIEFVGFASGCQPRLACVTNTSLAADISA